MYTFTSSPCFSGVYFTEFYQEICFFDERGVLCIGVDPIFLQILACNFFNDAGVQIGPKPLAENRCGTGGI